MSRTQHQGRNANKLGKMLENSIEDTIVRLGFAKLGLHDKQRFSKGLAGPEDLPQRWYATQVRKYYNLYGARFCADFVLFDSKLLPKGLIVESKAQEKPGSVDEKYVFTAYTLKKLSVPSWLILSGDGIRASAIEWLKRQETRTFKVFNESEFRRAMLRFER